MKSIETYETMLEDLQIDAAIKEAEDEIMDNGQLAEAKTVFDTLRKNILGN